MRKKLPDKIEEYRFRKGPFGSSPSDGMNGYFLIPHKNRTLKVLVSDRLGWDHVSVSLHNRTPTWDEMCFVKNIFFDEEETVIQYHPKKSKYVNFCTHCLHMWRKQGVDYELPPDIML